MMIRLQGEKGRIYARTHPCCSAVAGRHAGQLWLHHGYRLRMSTSVDVRTQLCVQPTSPSYALAVPCGSDREGDHAAYFTMEKGGKREEKDLVRCIYVRKNDYAQKKRTERASGFAECGWPYTDMYTLKKVRKASFGFSYNGT